MSRAVAVRVNKTESEILRDRIEFIELVLKHGNPRFQYDFYTHSRVYYEMVVDCASLVRRTETGSKDKRTVDKRKRSL